ncbi:MAG: alpha/beta hydrolase [Actinomycetota bacterium]
MTAPTTGWVPTPVGRVHVVRAGVGRPVLLLHQTPRSWDEFREVIDLLADEYHLVAVDLPGMGASDPHPDGPSIERYADAAAAVLEHLGLGPVAACGHHTGGVVAVDLAARRPELISQLVLSSTPWVDAAARAARAERTPVDTVVRSSTGDHLGALWAQRAPFYGGRTDLLDRFIVDALRATDPAEGHLAVGAYEMEQTIGQIRCAVTVVEHGEDPFASVHTEELVARLPGAVSVERIPDGLIPLEATAPAFAEVLRRALG